MSDVDADQALAETVDPVGEPVDLIERDKRVDEHSLLLAVDQRCAHRRPHRLIARSLRWRALHRPHRRDVDVEDQVGHELGLSGRSLTR